MRKSQIIALVVIIVMLIPSVIILCDFIGWHNTMTFVQQKIPTGAGTISPPIYIPHYGYIPFGWRGNFEKIWFRNYIDDEHAKKMELEDYIQIEFTMSTKFCNGANVLSINLQQSGDDFWGYWEMTESAKQFLANPSNDECRKARMRKPFGTWCEVYVHPDYTKNTLLVLILGEDKFLYRTFHVSQCIGSCGGGYITMLWGY